MSTTMTETGAKPANWSKLKDQVASWIDGENHCVTAQRISQTLDISRDQGSQLLQEILQENPKHQITTCHQIREVNTTGK
jgi:predicted XRE-type DNA-binding protein